MFLILSFHCGLVQPYCAYIALAWTTLWELSPVPHHYSGVSMESTSSLLVIKSDSPTQPQFLPVEKLQLHPAERRQNLIRNSNAGPYQNNLLFQKITQLCQAIKTNCSYYSTDTIMPISSEKRRSIPFHKAILRFEAISFQCQWGEWGRVEGQGGARRLHYPESLWLNLGWPVASIHTGCSQS